MKASLLTRQIHPLLLLFWFIIALGFRLANLTAKPPWTDEFSTLVFSLGNTFLDVPLDKAIAPDILLQPLQPQSSTSVRNVLAHLLTESNHPPLYFMLTHWWMQLFPVNGGLVSLWGARSLAAIFGALSIPAIYILSWVAFRSRLVGHFAAVMMAVSPYSIFLSQEARHYTLAILWVIASFACLAICVRHIQNRTALPIWVAISWEVINALGIATHYFFALTLWAELMVLLFLRWQLRKGPNVSPSPHPPLSPSPPLPLPSPWKQIYAVIVGTAVAGLVWLPVFLQNNYGGKLTEWIQGDRVGIAWISPIFQAFAAWLTMIYLLPVESPHLAIMIASGLVMLIFLICAAPILVRGFKAQLREPQNRLMTQVFAGVIVSAIAIFFIFTYFLDIDLTRGARYNFVYFPGVMVLLGASLAITWTSPGGKKSAIIICLVGFLSAITVISNLGYQKYYRPDLFVELIEKTSNVPVLIATTQKTHVHIGEMMGVAREFKIQHFSSSPSPLFLLAHQDENPITSTTALENTLQVLPRPLDLWLVNFYAPVPEVVQNCISELNEGRRKKEEERRTFLDGDWNPNSKRTTFRGRGLKPPARIKSLPGINGYVYKLFHCL
jgi:uncharacterized membrane protein